MVEAVRRAVRRASFGRSLDWSRFGFVVMPLFTVFPVHDPWVWPVAAATLVAGVPLVWSHPGGRTSGRVLLPLCLGGAVAGSGLAWLLVPESWCTVGMFSATFHSVRALPRRQWIPIALAVAVIVTGFKIRHHATWSNLLLLYAVLAVVVLLGVNRRSRADRLEQAELALARAQTATEEHVRAAALAERTRIARELHDVLAHSLAGLALNLQSTRLMLLRDGASPDTLVQLERAQKLAAEGLSEARKAVAALRDGPVPADRAVADLLAGYRLDSGARGELRVEGEPRELDTAPGTTIVRAVQEALSNTRKHAPGAEVDIRLAYLPGQVEIEIADHQGGRPPAPVTGGYGLRGMRERVELLGGRLDSGPVEDGWRVHLTVPA